MLLLSGIFLKFFGFKSFHRYLSGGTTVDRKQRSSETLDAPAIMVCAKNPITKIGWKNLTVLQVVTRSMCRNAKDAKELTDCIDGKTYSFKEVIIDAKDSEDKDLLDETAWEESLRWFIIGKCYFRKLDDGAIGFSGKKALKLTLNFNLEYYVMLGDPNPSANPKTTPRVLLSLKSNGGFKAIYIDVVEHIKLNDKDYPCEVSDDYSFTNCIRTKVLKKVGCRTKWENPLGLDLPLCNKSQIFEFSLEYEKYTELEQTELVEYTGCALPCSYKEYKLMEAPLDSGSLIEGNQSGLYVIFGNRVVLVEKEEKIFPFESFVAEFGGCLGLFIGFSFLVAWDMLRGVLGNIIHYLNQRYRNY